MHLPAFRHVMGIKNFVKMCKAEFSFLLVPAKCVFSKGIRIDDALRRGS